VDALAGGIRAAGVQVQPFQPCQRPEILHRSQIAPRAIQIGVVPKGVEQHAHGRAAAGCRDVGLQPGIWVGVDTARLRTPVGLLLVWDERNNPAS
jgi:hypothetical protein